MTVVRAQCPGCGATLNVPATMTHIKCSSCGTVWDRNNPSAAKRAAAPAKSEPPNDGEKNLGNNTAMIAIAGSAFALLALAGIGVVLFTGGDPEPAPPTSNPQAPANQASNSAPTAATSEYRIIKKLSEPTRKKLYYDYRQTAGSTVEKKVLVPSESAVAKSLGNMTSALAKREVQHFSLQYNISEDDVMQVVAEGDAKGWPPKRKESKTPSN